MVERLAPVAVRTAAVIRKSGLWDLALIVVAFVLYYLVRGVVVERAGEATQRAIRLMELEKNLGLFQEAEMQAWVMSSELAVLLDRYGGRIWARVAPERLHRAHT